MSVWPADIEQTCERIVAAFKQCGVMVATAESCTGGLIAGALTSIPGSSSVVDRGFVTYTNAAKVELLGVREATLAAHGAVSVETALDMVRGALAKSSADIAVAVTGIAGPGGGSAEKPVGLVHLAAASRKGQELHREMRYGDIGREAVRLETLRTALSMLLEISGTSA